MADAPLQALSFNPILGGGVQICTPLRIMLNYAKNNAGRRPALVLLLVPTYFTQPLKISSLYHPYLGNYRGYSEGRCPVSYILPYWSRKYIFAHNFILNKIFSSFHKIKKIVKGTFSAILVKIWLDDVIWRHFLDFVAFWSRHLSKPCRKCADVFKLVHCNPQT